MNPSASAEEYRCVTPPPLPKQDVSALATSSYASLISSPVTPPAQHRRPSLAVLNEEEREVLSAMLARAECHRDDERNLYSQTLQMGNSEYLKNRSVIVEWMTEVCTSFQFHCATLHMAVRHMDWVFARHVLPKHYWQLCAVTAVFVAAKCEEAGAHVPVLEDLKFICDNCFDEKLIRRMEVYMLQLLNWDLVAKTPVHFLNHYVSVVRRRAGQTRADGGRNRSRAPSSDVAEQPIRGCNVGPLESFLLDDEDDDTLSVVSDRADCTCIGECLCIEDELCARVEGDADEVVRQEGVHPFGVGCEDAVEQHARSGRAYPVVGEALHRVAKCLLDLSLYDPAIRGRFAPNVLAAAALSIASEVSGDACLRPADVSAITDVSEIGMLDCRLVLWKMFQEAQG